MGFSLSIIFIMFGLVAVYDVVIICIKGKPYSVSAALITSAYKFPIIVASICLIIGTVLGHAYWRMKANDINPNYRCYDVSKTPPLEIDL